MHELISGLVKYAVKLIKRILMSFWYLLWGMVFGILTFLTYIVVGMFFLVVYLLGGSKSCNDFLEWSINATRM